MRKLALLGIAGFLATRAKPLYCAGESDADKAAKELDKIYEEPVVPRTAAELETYLQSQARVSGYSFLFPPIIIPNQNSRPPAFSALNAALKSVTSTEAVAGFRVDLSGQISKHFQMGGMWQYNKAGGSFGFNTALIADAMVQDANFVAGTCHDNGKLESRGMLGLGKGFSVGGEAMFQGPDTRRAYYAVELNKAFDYCVAGVKMGSGMRTFSFMQTIMNGLFAGFECTYLV